MRILKAARWALVLSGIVFGTGAWAQESDEASQGPVNAVQACGAAVQEGHARCHSWILADENGHARSFTFPNGYHPADLRAAYKLTQDGKSTTTIAIVDAYHYANAEADLSVYRAEFGLPACTTANGCFKQVDQRGGTDFGAANLGWNQEEALDVDMASAICPNCNILVVEGDSSTYGNLATAVNTAASMGAHAISNSYGGGEAGTQTYEASYNHPGIAITVSTGDDGYGVQFPASSPHVTAVGGTTLHTDSSKRGWNETAWSGAGSGCSSVYAKPSWQKDTGCTRRSLADVSAVANPSTGVSVYGPVSGTQSTWLVFGGTSVASPIIAGVYGLNGKKVTYGSDPYAHTKNLYDITSGSNGSCGTYLCNAGPGYDGPTGLGTPKGIKAF